MVDVVNIPDRSVVLRLTAAAFSMHYPELWHDEIIPISVRRAMEPTWRTRYFAERPITFALLKDVYVVEEGLVFDSAGRVFQETITQHGQSEIDRGYRAVLSLKQDDMLTIPSPHVLCLKRGVSNYGHWLMEMLPKAFLARLYGLHLPLVVPRATGQLNPVITDTLQMISITESEVLRIGPGPVHFRELIVANGLTAHGVYMSPVVLNCADALAARIPGGPIEPIIVARAGTASRRLVNEEAVLAKAAVHGYKLVDTTQMSLAEQIAAFKNASKIIGVAGAALTNAVFAPRTATVTNIVPASMPDTFFWFIAGLKGQRYREIRAEQTGPVKGVAPWDTDIICQGNDVDRLLQLAD